jgi:hypothetical protein
LGRSVNLQKHFSAERNLKPQLQKTTQRSLIVLMCDFKCIKHLIMNKMKKYIGHIMVMMVLVALFGCQKESVDEIGEKLILSSEIMIPGEIYYSDTWEGWIDPNLTEDPVLVNEVVREEPTKKGERKTGDNGTIYIECPQPGTNCGNLTWTGGPGPPIGIGVYIKTGVAPGELFKMDDWIGWIDPDLCDEIISVPDIKKTSAFLHGYEWEEPGYTGIICITDGSNCGRLYYVDDSGVNYVGLFLKDE